MINNKAYVAFHQGWTDIVCQLPIINFYSKHYDEIKIFFREDSKELVNFYIKGLKNVYPIYVKTNNGSNLFEYFNTNSLFLDYDILFHGQYEVYRKDKIKAIQGKYFFIEEFYRSYGIEYNNRVDCFEFIRDEILENKKYEDFINQYGNNYVIYHDDPNNHLYGIHHKSTKINFDIILKDHEYVNLNQKSNIFFDYIKIIKNAKEIHLVDSIWAALIYQIDAKYSLFSEKQINLYPKRGHVEMFNSPKKLKNWKIIL